MIRAITFNSGYLSNLSLLEDVKNLTAEIADRLDLLETKGKTYVASKSFRIPSTTFVIKAGDSYRVL